MIKSIADLKKIKKAYEEKLGSYKYLALVCYGAGCISANCGEVRDALVDELEKQGLTNDVGLIETGCIGTCAVGPVVYILPDETYYTEMNGEKIRKVVKEHFIGGNPVDEYTFYDNIEKKRIRSIKDICFFKDQVRIALRNCGLIDVNCIDSYIAKDGYLALAEVLNAGDRMAVIETLKQSGLRGRGGGGFPVGIKWEAGYNAREGQKYIICNADEGDPGAFMDRSVFEGDAHSVIEGMLLGGYAIGADKGIVYIRAEYPIAARRLEDALKRARDKGLLGKDIFGSGFNFDIEIRIGAGAFVCGEETALMASVEGRRGEPTQKPPFPFQSGLYGRPTIINNVETLANIPAILLNGAEWFRQYGTKESPGTKVFALTGNIVNSGLVEIPMGMSLGDVIYDIGGGIPNDKKFKSAQTGGPSGGCITPDNINTPLDYNSLLNLGSMIGSGGLIVMDEDTCLVDTARFYLDFIQEESCGKCVACRIGTKRMLEILERITQGEGVPGDIEKLEELGHAIQKTAMCGLGQTAPNPVLSTIKHFREEFEEHIYQKYCRAGICSELYRSPCENDCPADIFIPGYMSLIATGKYIDAYRLMFMENPFSGICGRVCTHPCESRCRRGTVDEVLQICELKRFATDYAYDRGYPNEADLAPIADINKKIAIIGAGPSGLTCGYYLARLGYKVEVFESESKAGGVMFYGIPEYRLPKKIIEKEISAIEKAGVKIHLNTAVGKDISFNELKDNFDAVYVAAGAQKAARLGIEGENLDGVYHGLDILRRIAFHNDIDFTGKKVAVIGGGNSAIDSARTAIRLGASQVKIIYRREIADMPADKIEIEDAEKEGIIIEALTNPVSFVGKDGKLTGLNLVKQKLGTFDKSGRRKAEPIDGSQYTEEFDVAIPAVSQSPDTAFLTNTGVDTDRWGGIKANKITQATNIEGVFAGGDVYRGPLDIVHAIHDAKQAASAIDKYLGGKGELYKGEAVEITDYHIEGDIAPRERFMPKFIETEKCITNFCECNLGLHEFDAHAEAMRCLRCDRR